MTISTFSLESGDLPLPQEKPDSEQSDSASQIPVAGSFSEELGDCPLSPTSESSTAEHTPEFLFSLEDRHASPPAVPGSREAKEMTAGSGRKLCACLMKQSRIASFSRTLLESSTWGSTEYFLRWEGRATKHNASIFRLVPWTRPSSGTESGLSGFAYPTPRGSDAEHSGPNQMQHGEMALAKIASSWPTPNAKDESQHRNATANRTNPDSKHHDGQTLTDAVSTWPTLHGTAKEEYERRQGPTGNELGNLVNRTAATWPAPDASEAGKTSRSGERKDEPLIGGIVRASWPTPMSRDVKGQMFEKDGTTRMDYVPNVLKASWPTPTKDGNCEREGLRPSRTESGRTGGYLTEVIGKTQYGCLARTENFVVRLMTLSAWLMGYTGAYLARWETRSARKSQHKSYAP